MGLWSQKVVIYCKFYIKKNKIIFPYLIWSQKIVFAGAIM